MYTQRIISKVPGNIPSEPKKEKQGYIGDLAQQTIVQLNELLGRQLKLLANKAFINKLADKGEKITALKESIEAELKKRNESENLSRMMSALSVNGKEDLDALEWTGRCAPGHVATTEENNDSDDETDPFKILANHSGAGFHKKKHRILKPEEPLIKPSDVEDMKNVHPMDQVENQPEETEDEVLDEYAKHICEKMDSVNANDQKTKFMPYRTLKGSVERKEGEPKKGRGKWEVTAATPPPPVHGDVKMVSLQESIKLQLDQQHKFKEVQMRHAAERLAATAASYSRSIGRPPQQLGDYRDPASGSSSEDEGSEHEVHDEEEPDGGGVVIYNLVDDHENT
ncbi:DNA-directed RNA polymerase II subunit GRINL1A [Macrosteles quadrilineatus]|uniref:DNA-directed RNA polymerase II subunit GRINL1A n=1 Tax=Macrosteles quadrilineatus TaxID=74068 RepID=UPI0023E2818F|nr:DNA-directed RNA polymerase II subunit GRINL1A [Macrosteles quadrilineatus]